MACIIWQLATGEEFKVPEGKAHVPPLGAFNTGRIDWDCAGATARHEVDAMLEKHGVQWGSAIKWVTNKAGIKQCSSCKARETILNSAKELGWAETLKQLKETF
jgi:hypothetical protein